MFRSNNILTLKNIYRLPHDIKGNCCSDVDVSRALLSAFRLICLFDIFIGLTVLLFFFSAVERLIEKEPNLVNAKKSDGYTALHIAAINDHADTANILILKVSRIKVLITLYINVT